MPIWQPNWPSTRREVRPKHPNKRSLGADLRAFPARMRKKQRPPGRSEDQSRAPHDTCKRMLGFLLVDRRESGSPGRYSVRGIGDPWRWERAEIAPCLPMLSRRTPFSRVGELHVVKARHMHTPSLRWHRAAVVLWCRRFSRPGTRAENTLQIIRHASTMPHLQESPRASACTMAVELVHHSFARKIRFPAPKTRACHCSSRSLVLLLAGLY